MKNTQVKDATRNIRKRIVSYLSICLVIMLGVGAFLATSYMEAGISREASGYFIDHGFKDFELISSLGASEANIEVIRNTDGVSDAEGVMEFEGSLQIGDTKSSVTVLSMTERVSVPELVDGRLPAASDECAVGEDFAEVAGISAGDKITIYLRNSGGGDPLTVHSFTVTGLIKHPDFVHRKLTNTVVLPLKTFDMSVTGDAYTRVFVRANDVDPEYWFVPAYFEQVAPVKETLEDLSSTLASDRAAEVKQEAYDQIDEEWASALAELDNAEAEIAANEAELNKRLADGRSELNDAENELASELAKARKKIKNGEIAIADYEKKIKDGKAELAKKKKELEDNKKELAEKEKALKDAEAEFYKNTGWVEDALEQVEYLLDNFNNSEIHGSEAYVLAEKVLANLMLDNRSAVEEAKEFAESDTVRTAVKLIEKYTGKQEGELTKFIDLIAKISVDDIMAEAENVAHHDGDFSEDVLKKIKEGLEAIQEIKKAFAEAEALIADAKAKIADGEKQIADAEAELKAGEKLLKEKKAELKAGKDKMNKKKAAAEAKIKAGWESYYTQKAKYEAKLEEAKALLKENREEAEAKLAEAKAEVEEIDCDYIVLDRNANAGYVDVTVQLDALRKTGMVFGILFILITALVCFSTLTIIIEEQKKLIGTVKAFGFHKGEVLGKYLLFGVTAGLVGDILAVITGYVLSLTVQSVYSASNLYQYGHPGTIMRPVPTIAISLLMIAVCAAASIIACNDILRSPASMLMNGQTLRSKKAGGRTSVKRSAKSSLYSRLVLRNMKDDKVRVIISTVIVAFCCMLIGVGLSFKLATTGMLDRQAGDVNLFDLRMDMGDSVSDKEHAALIDVLEDSGVSYTEAVYESHLFRTDSSITGLKVLAADPDAIVDYMGINEEDGSAAAISSDGVLIPARMSENYGFEEGGNITIYDSSMDACDASVTGTYTLYFDRIVVTTPQGYASIFGEECSPNACYIKLDGADGAALKKALLSVSEDISFEARNDFKKSFDSVSMLYDIIVYVTTGVAIFMSFMILTNLASIFLTRKKNELIVMRVNGFSIKQTRKYLSREAVFTTIIGLAAGVLVGSLLAPYIVHIMEPADLQFDRSYHAIAWIAAAGLEGLFAVIIYSTTFRKIKKFNLKDIA